MFLGMSTLRKTYAQMSKALVHVVNSAVPEI